MSYINALEKILDSRDATAGGSTAAAMAGAMACGLIGMTARLSVMKCYGLEDRQYLELAEELDEMSFKLLRGVQEDHKAYENICVAMKLPRETDEEKESRSYAIETAGVRALEVIRDNGHLCKKVYKIGLMLKDNSDSNAASDLSMGISLAQAGIMGCAGGIRSNLPLVHNTELATSFRKDMERLLEEERYYVGDRQH